MSLQLIEITLTQWILLYATDLHASRIRKVALKPSTNNKANCNGIIVLFF